MVEKWLPIYNNKIVFDNFSGRGYGCNPKYIAEELIRRNRKYDIVWLVRDESEAVPPNVRIVKIYTKRANLELLTARVWISNVRNYKGVNKRKGQFYIQTWHSSLGLKKIEGDIADFPESKKRESVYDGSVTDLMFANNDLRIGQYKRAFWYDGKIIKCGVPRNAILFNTPMELDDKVRNLFGISKDDFIILYAPTYRDSSDANIYVWDFQKICNVFQKKYNRKAVILLRLHPNIVEQSSNITFNKEVINASFYPDMQELLAISDYLITDFSSCSFDFSFAKKPVLLYAQDADGYINNERGLVLKVEDLPFKLAKNENELVTCIENFEYELYRKECDCFFEKIGLAEDGKGAQKVADIIEDVIYNFG